MTNYLIDFFDTATEKEINDYLSANNCTIIKSFDNFTKVYHVQSTTQPLIKEGLVESVINDDASTLKLLDIIPVPPATPTRTETIVIADDKNWWKDYSIRYIDLSAKTADVPIFGEYTSVYLVDSGIDLTHPEFDGVSIDTLYSFTGEFSDSTGHGTSLASVIAGKTCGITATNLKVVKIFDKNQPTRQSDLLAAFDAILADMLTSPNFAAINLSWAIERNYYIENKIRFLIEQGAVVLAASGNSGIPIGDVTPAAMKEVITVGSYDQNFLPSNFSNYTDPTITSLTQSSVNEGILDTWAPGEKIWAAKPGGTYGYIAGTSVATAIYSASVVYNQTRWATPTGESPSFTSDINGLIDLSWVLRADRTGLLNLSDPRYSSSNNSICTFQNERNTNIRVYPIDLTVLVLVGEKKPLTLFRRELVKSYEFLTPLPNFAIDDFSVLTLMPTEEPIGANGYDLYTIQYKTYMLDGSTIDNTLTVIVGSSTFDQTALPSTDPLVGVELLTNCGLACPGTCNVGSHCTTVKPGNCYCII
jgi:hypothetical protein